MKYLNFFSYSCNDAVQWHIVIKVQFHSILVGGDQLAAARAIGAIKHMMNALTPAARLEDLPVTEDWHTKVALLGVSYKRYIFNEVI